MKNQIQIKTKQKQKKATNKQYKQTRFTLQKKIKN